MSTFTNYTYCSDCAEMTLNHNNTCPCCGSDNVSHHTMHVNPADVILGDNDVIRWELMHESDLSIDIDQCEEMFVYLEEWDAEGDNNGFLWN